MIKVTESYIDGKGNGHIKGTINNKIFHIAGSDGYCDDAIGNLSDTEYTQIFKKIILGE